MVGLQAGIRWACGRPSRYCVTPAGAQLLCLWHLGGTRAVYGRWLPLGKAGHEESAAFGVFDGCVWRAFAAPFRSHPLYLDASLTHRSNRGLAADWTTPPPSRWSVTRAQSAAEGVSPGPPAVPGPRPLPPEAFERKVVAAFPRGGSVDTPLHRASSDFEWRDYCPLVFRWAGRAVEAGLSAASS